MKKSCLKTFLLTFGILLIVMIILGIYPFGKNTLIVSDLRDQYMIFIGYLKNMDSFYTFSGSLGENFLTLGAYYLMSIFNIFTLFFNSKLMPLIITFIIVLKICLSSVSMMYYLNKSYGEKKENLLFSLSYGLMGYVVAFYFHIMWFDAIILFPLVVLGIENIINKKKSSLYIISLTLLILSNYYFGVIVCIFSVLYFIYLLFLKKKFDKRVIFKYIISSLLSGMMCMVILVPMVYGVLNGKALINMDNPIIPTIHNSMSLLSKILPFSFAGSSVYHGAANIYVGSLTIICVILYFFSDNNKREKVINLVFITILFLTFRIHFLDLLFHGLTEPNCFDYRHAFLLSFMLIKLGYEGYQKEFIKNKYLLLGIISFHLIIFFFGYDYFKDIRVLLLILSMIIMIIYTFLLEKKRFKYLILLLVLELFGNSLNTIGVISLTEKDKSNLDSYKEYITLNEDIINEIKRMDNTFYRMEKDYHHENSINDSMLFDYNGVSHFDSTSNAKTEKFLENVGFRRLVTRAFYGTGSTRGVDMLLGIKYLLSLKDNFKDYEKIMQGDINVFENPYYIGMGFMNDFDNKDILFTDNIFENLNNIFNNEMYVKEDYHIDYINVTRDGDTYKRIGDNAKIVYTFNIKTDNNYYLYFKDNLVRENYKTATIKINDRIINDYFTKYNYSMIDLGRFNKEEEVVIEIILNNDSLLISDALIYYEDDNVFMDTYNKLRNKGINITKINSSKLEMNVESGSVILSIPYDKGWKIKNNGKEIDYYEVFNGLIGFNANEGEVSLEYLPSGLKIGSIISVISLLGTIIYLIKEKHEKEI